MRFRRPTRALLATLLLAAVTAGTAAAQWTDDGVELWTSDRVGIGTSSPTYRLHVVENTLSPVMKSESGAGSGIAFYGVASGVNGTGVVGAGSSSGSSVGVKGYVASPNGKALWGYADATNGVNYGVYGQTSSPDGYSGFFTGGKFYYGGEFMGVGRDWQVNGCEALGVHKNTSSWGGMYVDTLLGGEPYYGYATNGVQRAYHFYDSYSGQWRLSVGGDRITVDRATGRVGIKTTNASYDLHVNGSAGKPGGGSWSNASDRRLKKDMVQLDGALERLLAVRGVSFEYRDPEAIGELPGRQLGVIAQEVEAVFPGWVDTGDDGYERVTFRGFEGVAIEALRELATDRDRASERLETQSEELEDLRAENERLGKELDGLRGRMAALEKALAGWVPGSGNGRRATADHAEGTVGTYGRTPHAVRGHGSCQATETGGGILPN